MITEEQFKEIYPQEYWDLYHLLTEPPASRDEFLQFYLPSKLWRLNNLYTIINKHGEPVRFEMNLAQHKVYAASLIHPRVIILKSRQQGISTFWLVSFFDDAVFRPHLNIGLMAQGTDEASTLLERTKFLWDNLGDDIKNFLGLSLTKDNTKEFALSNGSTIFIRTSFRSATLQRLHISEMGKIANKYPERARETKTGTLQALAKGNTGVIESTAEGRNMFKDMWDKAVEMQQLGQKLSSKDFYPVFLSWLDDPDCVLDVEQEELPEHTKYFERLEDQHSRPITKEQRWFWIAQHRELGDDVYQEYPATPEEAFMQTKNGAYYAKLYTAHVIRHKRLVSNLWDRNLPVHLAFDLGMSDTFTICFFQIHRGTWRIIDEYTNSGEGLAHYVSYLHSLPYEYGVCYLPHDVKVRDLSTGQTRLHTLKQLGMRQTKVLPKANIAEGIEAVRAIIPKLWIDTRCRYLQDCLVNYTKEWDEIRNVWKSTPLHDQYSHGADAIRYMAMGTKELLGKGRMVDHTAVIKDGLAL